MLRYYANIIRYFSFLFKVNQRSPFNFKICFTSISVLHFIIYISFENSFFLIEEKVLQRPSWNTEASVLKNHSWTEFDQIWMLIKLHSLINE